MAHIARFREQRKVNRGRWEPRFTKQRINHRGSTNFTTPTLTSISPTTAVHGAANGTITATGTGFISGITKITYNLGDQPTTWVSATSVTAPVTNLTAIAGTMSVNVRTGNKFSTTAKTYTWT
jgi:hypothetical protein